MTEVTLDDVPQKIKGLFNKGYTSLERGNLDYAVELLSSCVKAEPNFLHARKCLRAAEIQRFKKKTGLAQRLASVSALPSYIGAMAMFNAGKADKALLLAEKVMETTPLDLKVIRLQAQVADAQGLADVAIQTLCIARDHYPQDIEVMKMLGELYMRTGQTREGRQLFEQLGEMCPRDPEVLKAIKDAMAMESMDDGGWNEATSYRDIIKDTNEASLLEKEAKAVRGSDDVDILIEDAKKKIEVEPENVNHYRALARLYADKNSFDLSLEALAQADAVSPGDPEVDHARSLTRIKKFDHEINALREAGDEAAMEAKAQEKVVFVFNDLQERVTRYPNDLKLRYEWGCKLFDNEYVDEAIEEFQRSQRNPQLRQKSLLHLATCFKVKKQYDLAIDQLQNAASELLSMDTTKKDVLYELGEILVLMGQPEKAAGYFKQIYQVDIAYKDIRDKVEQAYSSE